MWRLFCAVVLMAGTAPAPASAQPATVTSLEPGRVALLTVYRAPYGRGAIDLRFLQGFAMVTETRRVRLGTIEKNRDARLLSPASLVDGTLGRQVTLTRTDKATGRTVSEPAAIVAGPRRGVILRTAAGIEALRCSGLPERITFGGVPGGLSSKPVLRVTTNSPAARTVTVRLTYLALGFDWRASYVATLDPDGRTLGLFA